MRFDTLEREWRVISGHRQGRPNLPTADCPFCPGGLEAPEPYRVRVFPNRWPAMQPGPPVVLDPHAGPVPARGATEVILYSPDHGAFLGGLPDDHLADVVEAWRERTDALAARPEVEYVLCFENRGSEVGATIHHPHGQIYGFPFVPPRPRRIFGGPDCRVCTDLSGADLVLADDRLIRCWLPRASAWPYAFRLAPTRHCGSLADLAVDEEAAVRAQLSAALRALDALWTRPMPYMLDLHQHPCDGGEWPGAHLFFEVACPVRAPGIMRHVAAGEIGSGLAQNPVRPEDAAAALRAVWTT